MQITFHSWEQCYRGATLIGADEALELKWLATDENCNEQNTEMVTLGYFYFSSLIFVKKIYFV